MWIFMDALEMDAYKYTILEINLGSVVIILVCLDLWWNQFVTEYFIKYPNQIKICFAKTL